MIPPTNIDKHPTLPPESSASPFHSRPTRVRRNRAWASYFVSFCALSSENTQMLIYVDDSMPAYLFVVSRHWTLIIWTLAVSISYQRESTLPQKIMIYSTFMINGHKIFNLLTCYNKLFLKFFFFLVSDKCMYYLFVFYFQYYKALYHYIR